MRPALLIYCVFLLIEAGLAWLVSGNWFLAAAVSSGLLIYAGVWRFAGPWGELVRALFAGIITVAGPLYYKSAMVPTVMCFLALPHLLAATQCFWEMALSRDPAQQNARMRTVIFSVAFYAALALVFCLLRGMEPEVSRWVTSPLAVGVLLLALPAWDMARVGRLKPGHSMSPAGPRGQMQRVLIAVVAAIGMAFLFSGLLPPAAEKLCEVSPRWKGKDPTDAPPVPQPQPPAGGEGQPGSGTGEATRPGADSSDMSGQHQLPEKSNIQSSGEIRLFLKCRDDADAQRLSAGPVYVRTHTFDSYREGVWKSSITGSRWLEDAADGTPDGWTTARPAPAGARPVEHTIFLNGADGYSLPALQGVTGYRFSRVFAVPGDQFQTQLAGSVRYDARSAPVIYDLLPNRADLKIQDTGTDAHLQCTGGPNVTSLVFGDKLLRPEGRSLAEKVEGLRQWFTVNVKYSTKVNGRPPLTPLDNFLSGERRGFCDFYASASCLMLREAGVPARVAYGYAGRSFDPKTGVFSFTDDTAHAWTEIHLSDYGWTVCDFTPQDNIGDLNGQPDEPPPLDEQAFEQPEKEEKPEKPAEEKPAEPTFAAWWQEQVQQWQSASALDLLRRVLPWVAVCAALIFLARWLQKRKSSAAAGEDSFEQDGQQPLYFAEFLRVFRNAGRPRPAGATPREYVRSLRDSGAAGAEFDPMLAYHYAVRYTGADADHSQEEQWLALVRETERRIQAQDKA
jgi:hypothetical protein